MGDRSNKIEPRTIRLSTRHRGSSVVPDVWTSSNQRHGKEVLVSIHPISGLAQQESAKADVLREEIRGGRYKVDAQGVATAMLTQAPARSLLGFAELASEEPRAA